MSYLVRIMDIGILILAMGAAALLGWAVTGGVRPWLTTAFHIMASLPLFDRNDMPPQDRVGL